MSDLCRSTAAETPALHSPLLFQLLSPLGIVLCHASISLHKLLLLLLATNLLMLIL
jgi:hypothetical protein